ncbi:hypothetical protein [Psychrobacillus sp. BM2]|uniref:hypothetical protein n=1 Tax=Psychrobacillus sp. BM2 TaxID=3400421 RepID=UPI003B01DA5B
MNLYVVVTWFLLAFSEMVAFPLNLIGAPDKKKTSSYVYSFRTPPLKSGAFAFVSVLKRISDKNMATKEIDIRLMLDFFLIVNPHLMLKLNRHIV